MSEQLTVTSTTDSQQQVEQAAELVEGDTLVHPDDVGYESPHEVVKDGGITVASTTDPAEAVQEAAEDLKEEREERRDEYLGKSRRKQAAQIRRLHEKIDSLQQQLAGQPSQPSGENGEVRSPEPPDQPPQNGEANRQQLEEQLRWETAKLQAEIAYPYKVEAAKQRYNDFEQSLNAAKDHEVPQWTIEAMRMANNGPDIAYWLSKHTDYADELLRLDRAGQGQKAFELLNWVSSGLSFGQLHNASSEPRQRVRTAPAPISPIGGRAAPAHQRIDDPNIPFATYKRLREEQEARRGR